MPGLHTRRHPEFQPDCFACKILTVRANKGGLMHDRVRERQLERDRAAYLDLRRAGLQPHHVDGCERLAEQRIEGQFDIDYGAVIAREDRGAAKEAIMASKEAGLLP